MIGQLVADARVALALAARALRGYAKSAAPTQALCEAQRLLAQLLVQDIDEEPEDGGGPAIRRGTAKDRIVSTTDPEMRHGRKSRSRGFEGYKAAIVVETESGVLLATDVRGGNVHDREGAAPLIAEAVERSGQELEEVLGDTAYGDTETRKSIEALGAEVIAKAPPGTRKGMFDRRDFRVDSKRGVAHCPARKRVVVEHRIGRLVQLGIRQARYFGKIKTGFQISLVATVANLMLVAAVSGGASSGALSFALLVGIASLAFRGLMTQNEPLEMAPSRPGL